MIKNIICDKVIHNSFLTVHSKKFFFFFFFENAKKVISLVQFLRKFFLIYFLKPFCLIVKAIILPRKKHVLKSSKVYELYKISPNIYWS